MYFISKCLNKTTGYTTVAPRGAFFGVIPPSCRMVVLREKIVLISSFLVSCIRAFSMKSCCSTGRTSLGSRMIIDTVRVATFCRVSATKAGSCDQSPTVAPHSLIQLTLSSSSMHLYDGYNTSPPAQVTHFLLLISDSGCCLCQEMASLWLRKILPLDGVEAMQQG